MAVQAMDPGISSTTVLRPMEQISRCSSVPLSTLVHNCSEGAKGRCWPSQRPRRGSTDGSRRQVSLARSRNAQARAYRDHDLFHPLLMHLAHKGRQAFHGERLDIGRLVIDQLEQTLAHLPFAVRIWFESIFRELCAWGKVQEVRRCKSCTLCLVAAHRNVGRGDGANRRAGLMLPCNESPCPCKQAADHET